jgi:hypothetical protein
MAWSSATARFKSFRARGNIFVLLVSALMRLGAAHIKLTDLQRCNSTGAIADDTEAAALSASAFVYGSATTCMQSEGTMTPFTHARHKPPGSLLIVAWHLNRAYRSPISGLTASKPCGSRVFAPHSSTLQVCDFTAPLSLPSSLALALRDPGSIPFPACTPLPCKAPSFTLRK